MPSGANILLDSMGRRVLGSDGSETLGQCCFANAIKCSDNSTTTFWMKLSDAITVAAFKYMGTCYKFGSTVEPCIPSGGTLIALASVTSYASCDACAPGSPCTNCSSGTTPPSIPILIAGIGACLTSYPGGDAAIGPEINGQTYDVPRFSEDFPCTFIILDQPGSFGIEYNENTSCGTPYGPLNEIRIGVGLGVDRITVTIFLSSPGAQYLVFSGSMPMTAPYDCGAKYVISNEVANTDDVLLGGTVTVNP